MIKSLEILGHSVSIVTCKDRLCSWLDKKGWAVISTKFCQTEMADWLIPKYCLKWPCETYYDVTLKPKEKARRIRKSLRNSILSRDGRVCLRCGKSESDGICLTMHHIRPFSRGGSTTPANLMVLCQDCNQNIADNYIEELYNVIGQNIRVDLNLLHEDEKTITLKRWPSLFRLSSNMMYTRIPYQQRKQETSKLSIT